MLYTPLNPDFAKSFLEFTDSRKKLRDEFNKELELLRKKSQVAPLTNEEVESSVGIFNLHSLLIKLETAQLPEL